MAGSLVARPCRQPLDHLDERVRVLGTDELTEALRFAADNEITAVPTYVIDRRWSIPGAQDPDTFVQVIKRLAARASDERARQS